MPIEIGEGQEGQSVKWVDGAPAWADEQDLSSYATKAGSETLTNKTVSLASNTVSGTTAQFNAALSDGNFATQAGTETLTNKTLNESTINSPLGLTKNDVGLGNVNNTSDVNKPISTATQTALDLKQDASNAVISHGASPTEINAVWAGSQAQYDALTPNANTLYFIV